MLFVGTIVSIDETKDAVNNKLAKWKDNLGSKGFKCSRCKTECLECKFSEGEEVISSVTIISKVGQV